MPSINASIVKQRLLVNLTADGTDVATVQVISTLLRDDTTSIATAVEKTYTKAEAAAAGITGAQLSAFMAAAERLRANHQMELLGA